MPDTTVNDVRVLDQPLAGGLPTPGHGVLVTHLLIVSDQARSCAFYRDVLGGEVVRGADPVMIRLHNSWLILNSGGGPTSDKPDVTATPPESANVLRSGINLRVADIHAAYREYLSRGAKFLTPPIDRGPEIRCYIADPDGHLIEVGQAK